MRYFDFFAELSLIMLSRQQGISMSKFQEPDYTAALTIYLPRLLNMFELNGAKYGGCFIHQKPYVNFKSKKGDKSRCEAGDLLVVLKQTIDGIERYNATLFQLKMHSSTGIEHKISDKGELIQKELYTDWPQFEISYNGTLDSFDIEPKTVTPGAQYMIIKKLPSDTKYPYKEYNIIFFNNIPSEKMKLDLYNNNTFGSFLNKFINWITGRPISDSNNLNDDWSQFIWKLLEISKNSSYPRRNVGISGSPRAAGSFFSLMTDAASTKTSSLNCIRDYVHSRSYNFESKCELADKLLKQMGTPRKTFEYEYKKQCGVGISTLYIEMPPVGSDKGQR